MRSIALRVLRLQAERCGLVSMALVYEAAVAGYPIFNKELRVSMGDGHRVAVVAVRPQDEFERTLGMNAARIETLKEE